LHGLLLAKRLHDNFIMLNSDVKTYSFGHTLFFKAFKIISDVSVSVPYQAFVDTKLRLDQMEIIFRGISTESWWREDQVILRVKGTDRVICVLRDDRWVGMVEPYGTPRDYIDMKESLVPGIAKEAMETDPDGVKRQGEWYFVRRPNIKKPRGMKPESWGKLEDECRHRATRKIIVDGKMYVSGTIRHKGRRPMLSLVGDKKKEVWYEVARAAQVASWQSRFHY